MEPRHVAIFTPLTPGHVYPALDVVSELVRRGYRVTYPTNEYFSLPIRETGAEPIKFKSVQIRTPDKLFPHSLSDDANYWRMFAALYGPFIVTATTTAVAELAEFYETNPPDLILYEWWSFAGRILARHLGCPTIQVCAHFAHRDSLMRIDGVETTPEAMLKFSQFIDSLMSLFGFEGERHLWHVEKLNIFFLPKEFQYDADSFDSRFKFVGATHRRIPRAPIWKNRSENGRPLLLISETTASMDDRFFKLCIQVFANSQYYVVFSKGLNSTEAPSTQLPDNFEINREALNCEILQFADVMLCQGGMGTTLESLYWGVPVVAVTPTPFHKEVAYRLAELGLGIYMPEDAITSDLLKSAVDTAASDNALRERVKCMQRALRSSSGGEAAANAIEEFLAQECASSSV